MPAVFVYVLPLLGEEWLKLGMSGDPLRRAREFSPRFFDVFDFDAAFLIETEGRKDAGRIELMLRRSLRLHRAPMPQTIRPDASGHTEWLRGAYPSLRGAGRQLEADGYSLHAPAKDWFTTALGGQRQLLNSWARAVLTEHGLDPDHDAPGPLPASLESLLCDALDAFHHFGWRVDGFLPLALQAWYAAIHGRQENDFTSR